MGDGGCTGWDQIEYQGIRGYLTTYPLPYTKLELNPLFRGFFFGAE
jgi:hypothetical protein